MSGSRRTSPITMPGPTLAHGIPYLFAAERDRDVEPDGVMDPMFYADMKAAASAVGAKGSASAVDTVGDGDPCPKHRALGVNDGCPDCDPAVLS